MTLKQILPLFGLLVIVVVVFVVWGLFAKPPAPAVETHVLAGTLTEEGEYEYVEETPYYRLEAHYPARTPLEAAADKAARMHIETELKAAMALFKEENRLDALTAEDIQMQGLGEGRKYALELSYDMYNDSGALSYVYTVYADTLGAHPNTYYRTFVFDTSGMLVSLDKLFTTPSYLTTLSELAYPLVLVELKERAGEVTPEMEDEVRVGTSPSPEALQFFYLSDGMLHLLFPPYQVAAYAAGPFDIAIPLSQLEDALDPRFK